MESSHPLLKIYFIIDFTWTKKFIYFVVLLLHPFLVIVHVFHFPVFSAKSPRAEVTTIYQGSIQILHRCEPYFLLNPEEKIKRKNQKQKQTSILFLISSHCYWHRLVKAKSLSWLYVYAFYAALTSKLFIVGFQYIFRWSLLPPRLI